MNQTLVKLHVLEVTPYLNNLQKSTFYLSSASYIIKWFTEICTNSNKKNIYRNLQVIKIGIKKPKTKREH